METKWKKGDKVRVRSDLGCKKRYKMLTSNCSATPSYVMAHFFAGTELTISHASQLGYWTEETGRDFTWTDEMFEEALPEIGISIYREGRMTIAENVFTGEKGIAKCHPDDDFSWKYGVGLAMSRLLEMPYINGRECMEKLNEAVELITAVYLALWKGYGEVKDGD